MSAQKRAQIRALIHNTICRVVWAWGKNSSVALAERKVQPIRGKSSLHTMLVLVPKLAKPVNWLQQSQTKIHPSRLSTSQLFHSRSTPPGKVMSFVVYLNKTLTFSNSKNSTTKQARTVSTGNGTRKSTTLSTRNATNDETTTVVVEPELLKLPQRLNYATIDSPKLNLKAFDKTVSGLDRSIFASRKAKSRSTQLIVNAILSSGTVEQQALALRSACLHPKTVGLTKAAGLLPIAGARVQKLLIEGVKRTFKEVLGSGKRQKVNANRSTFAEILSSSFAGSEATNTEIGRFFELDK